MVLFSAHWTLHPHGHEDLSTMYHSMTEEEIKKEHENVCVHIVASFNNYASMMGVFLMKASSVR